MLLSTVRTRGKICNEVFHLGCMPIPTANENTPRDLQNRDSGMAGVISTSESHDGKLEVIITHFDSMLLVWHNAEEDGLWHSS
jgi:hypothetical protein